MKPSRSTPDARRRRLVVMAAAAPLAAGGILDRRILSTTEDLAQGSMILASDFGFRQAVATGDRGTILSALNNLATRIRADRIMLLALDGIVMADTGAAADDPFPLLAEAGQVAGHVDHDVGHGAVRQHRRVVRSAFRQVGPQLPVRGAGVGGANGERAERRRFALDTGMGILAGRALLVRMGPLRQLERPQ